MLINTAVFGEIDVSEDKVFDMPNGLFGFDFNNKYALLTKQEDDVTLMWYQAVGSRMPCFVVFNPYEIINGYEPVLEKSDLKALGVSDNSELQFLVVAVVPENISEISVNLKSPIVINNKEKMAKQVILQNDYPIKFSLCDSNYENDNSRSDENTIANDLSSLVQ